MSRRLYRCRYGWLLPILFALSSCGGSSSSPDASSTRGDLVAVTSTTSMGLSFVNLALTALENYGMDVSGLSATYGVTITTITYKTITPDGRLINASGVVAYPNKTGGAASPVLSYQHPTIFRDSDAPSNTSNNDAMLIAAAGSGYIVVIADYIGYARSGAEVHTYVHAEGLAAAVVDMLRASRQLLTRNGVTRNGQLFLAGYSEGGYATLAAQKEIEQNLSAEFTLTASMPGAGPYDMSSTAQYLLGLANNPNPELTGFVFKAYDHWYGWNRLSQFFQSPYDTVIDTFYDGTHSSSTIRAALTTTTANLLQPAFLTAFLGSGETAIKTDIARNDIYNWAPQVPTRLFHGDQDSVVPYVNATTTVTAMQALNAPSVTLVNCSTPSALIPRDHAECVPDYLGKMTAWFATLASDL